MKNLSTGFLLVSLIASQAVLACTKDATEGFLPKNNFYISVKDKDASGITEEQFNGVIDQVEGIYAPIVAQYGGKLQVVRKWSDGKVNAFAEQIRKDWKVFMFGGLARHKTITPDGFTLVICHEIGHHIGGAPKYFEDNWASNEGQSDYFATLKCLRRVWLSEDNSAAVKGMDVPKFLSDSCIKQWSSKADQDLCIRGAMAGDSVAKLFAAILRESKPALFNTPDLEQVLVTDESYPATQCRLDTYFQGALCEKSFNEEIAQEEEVSGTCHGSTGQNIGLRPRCWFRPEII